jgi:hypothetical protein
VEASGHKKRYFDSQNMLFTENGRSTEKKHFGRHYADSVSLENKVRKSYSPYFSIKPAAPPSPNKYDNTSLHGIGTHDKSNNLPNSRPCIRVYHNRETSIY